MHDHMNVKFGIAARLWATRSWARLPAEARDLSVLKNVQMIWGPPTLLQMGTEIFFSRYSGRGVQTHCSPSTNVKVKKLSRIVPLLHLQPLSRALCQCNSVNFRMTDLSTPWPSVPPPPITARCKFVIFTLRPL